MPKPFAWSFSKLKNYETCPLKYQQVDLLKAFREAPSKELKWGDEVHHAIAAALLNKMALPKEMQAYQPWLDKVNTIPGDLYVEQKYAINKDFKPTGYFDGDVWFRGIGDAVKIIRDRGVIVDWKTGAIKADSVQLMLMAQCLFSHFPQLVEVYTMYVWLKEDTKTVEIFTRQDLADGWLGLFDRVNTLENATKTNNFPPKPSGLCKRHCPVASCQFHGKGAF